MRRRPGARAPLRLLVAGIVAAGLLKIAMDLQREPAGAILRPGSSPTLTGSSPELAGGLAALDAGDPERAESLLRRVGPSDKAYSRALLALARLYEIQGDIIAARSAAGLARAAEGKAVEAIGEYERALAADPGGAAAAQADFELRELLRERPELVEVHYLLAFIASARRMPDAERAHLKEFLSRRPAGPLGEAARRRLAVLEDPARDTEEPRRSRVTEHHPDPQGSFLRNAASR